MTVLLIDLDTPEPPESPRPLPSWWQWQVLRPVLLGLIAAVLVAPIAGSASPAPPRFGTPVRIPLPLGGEIHLSRTGLAVTDPGGSVLRGFGLDGRPRWTTRLPVSGEVIGGSDGSLVVLAHMPPTQLLVYDEDTGALRWRAEGNVLAISDDMVLLGGGPTRDRGVQIADDIVARDWRDGRERWRITDDPRRVHQVFGWKRIEGLILAGDGDAEFVDIRTGVRLPLRDWPEPAGGRQLEQTFLLHGMLVVISGPQDGGSVLRVYGTEGGAPLWTRSVDFGFGTVTPCGPALCIPDGSGGAYSVDPRTGVAGIRYPFGTIADAAPGRFVGTWWRQNGPGGIGLLDAATGKVLSRLDEWWPVGPLTTPYIPVVRWAGNLDYRIGLLRASDGRVHLLADQKIMGVPGSAGSCQANGTHLACEMRSNHVLVWRYDVGPDRKQ